MIWFLWLFILLGIGAISESSWLVITSISILFILGIITTWQKFSLSKVTYHRRWHYRRGFPGETTNVKIEVENHKFLPLSWLRIRDTWPMQVSPMEKDAINKTDVFNQQGEMITTLSLQGRERISRTYQICFRERGLYQVGPAQLESGDYFGFYETQYKNPHLDTVIVFPELLALQELNTSAENPFGVQRAQRKLFEDPTLPMGIRPYQPEDDFRSIHWPATARTGQLQVKVYQPISSQVMVLCLNILTSEHPWIGMNQDLLERLIKVCATLAYHSSQRGYAVGLISNGCMAHADRPFNIAPGRSPTQLATILQALAAVTPYHTGQFEPFLMNSLKTIPYGATLVILTGVLTPLLGETILRLKRYRSNIILYTLDPNPPGHLPGIRVIHLPFSAEEKDDKA
jgi:uncharacterized protein (DUF58 family)